MNPGGTMGAGEEPLQTEIIAPAQSMHAYGLGDSKEPV